MSSSTLIEVFGHIVFSFTGGVTEHYNPQEPEYTTKSELYSLLERTGREWFRLIIIIFTDKFLYILRGYKLTRRLRWPLLIQLSPYELTCCHIQTHI